MADSFDLAEELATTDFADYPITNECPSENIEAYLEAAIEKVAENCENIGLPDILDFYRSILKHASEVDISVLGKFVDSIMSGLQAELDATIRDEQETSDVLLGHKKTLEIYAFLLYWFSRIIDASMSSANDPQATLVPKGRRKKAGKAASTKAKQPGGSWSWIDHIPGTLELITQLMKRLHRVALKLWTTAERDDFIQCCTAPAYTVMANETYIKNDAIKKAVLKVICFALKHQGHTQRALTDTTMLLRYQEHVSEPIAELIACLVNDMDITQLGDELLQNISTTQFAPTDTKGVKSHARFLIHLGIVAPKAIMRQLSLILGQVDSEAYNMRIAVLEVLGSIIKYLAGNESGDAEQRSNTTMIKELYQVLLERMRDVSSYVRSKVLQILIRLCEEVQSKFPYERLRMAQCAEVALMDKVATVRKNAIALLIKLVETHPYLTHGGELEREAFQIDYRAVKEELKKFNLDEIGKVVDQQEEGEAQLEEQHENRMDVDEGEETEKEDDENEAQQMEVDGEESKPQKKKKRLARRSTLNVQDLNREQASLAAIDTNKVMELKLRKKYLTEALEFISILENSMDQISKLLGSTHKAEVLESMEFFKIVDDHKMDGAEVGIKRMLHLIWTKDNTSTSSEEGELKGIKSRLLECYRNMYFEPIANVDPKGQINRIAKNMVERTYNATLAELTSLEEMMRIMMEEEHVHEDVINKLWQIYGADRPLPKPQRRGAIMILGMLALAKRSVLTDRVDVMLRVGLGKWGKHDLTLARYTCVALQRLNGSAKKIKGSLEDRTLRISMDNAIFKRLQEMVEASCRSKEWFGLAEQAINTIYALGERPDELCNQLMKKLTARALTPKSISSDGGQIPGGTEPSLDKPMEDKNENAMDQDLPATGSTETDSPSQANMASRRSDFMGDPFELSQILFVVGHVAIKQLVHLEVIEKELKRQKDEAAAAEKAAQARSKKKKNQEEDLDQVVGNAEDEIGEKILAVKETELLHSPNALLAGYGDLLVHICGSPHIYKNQTLRAAAILSFSKFLCVSPQFCSKNHPLLFKILETSRDANIRSNIVIALGDVAVSFSHILDESSDELYRGLSDSDVNVKKNTLMVLTHLILNSMIKVKGQLGEIAKCLQDEDPRIADLAKLFFTEFSTKDNAIYNNLPDVISHLSTGPYAVEEKVFRETLRYIFQFIEKERQAENIVEKLCQRFRLSEESRQWRDIAFCLSLLPFKSEKSVRKLIEGLPCYKDKLHESEVYALFQEILTKARSNKAPNKPDTELDEFEQILNDNKEQGEEDQALEKRVEGKKAAVKKKAVRRGGRKKAVPSEETGAPDEDEDA